VTRDPKPKTALGRAVVGRDRAVKRDWHLAFRRHSADIERLIAARDHRKLTK
jgi:hypothetical protein